MKALICALAAIGISACASTEPFAAPAPGATHYRYELIERVPGQPDKGYRLDYDITTGRDHGVVAIVHGATELNNGVWANVSIDAACTTALHAQDHELARVTLWPIAPETARSMNASFMADCAPAALFYPMSDILNVALVQTAPQFKLATLHAPGDRARFDAYATAFERLGVAISVAAPGGEVRLESRDANSATVLWASDPMQLRIIHHATTSEPEVTLSGVENFAFRLEIDARTGALQRANTTSDALNLVVSMPGLAPEAAPHLRITRDVTIERVH